MSPFALKIAGKVPSASYLLLKHSTALDYPTLLYEFIPIQDRGPRRLPWSSSFLFRPLLPRSITSLSPSSICISSLLYRAAHIVYPCISTTLVTFLRLNLFTFALYYPRLETAASTPQVTETPGMHHRSTEDTHRRY